ncbi:MULTISPECIES: hypothetical protein [Nostoc]|uniref:DUF4013 domain-containing protein n=1 Tax=Nostoc paludosum FACHB-159 TaxID=2692908 RepID=A0ABR8K5L3_9NOSO|nr:MULTISPECIES: hypothetical protein [Nostoc]MBD2677507.1 hypothetical protein [Nostoc sp. FACHB-857]MBD2734099.1 hypothetical protein [Nostoc paludosum FACHB-159]
MSTLSELQSRKLGLLELISIGFDLYLKNFTLFLGIYCIALPFSAIILVGSTGAFSSNPILLILYVLFYLFYLIVVIPGYGAAYSIITEGLILGQRPQIEVIFRRILAAILPLVGLNLRFGINYFFRFLLLAIPGIIYLVNNGFYTTAFILRDQRGKAALEYSKTLVKGNWWRVFFFYLITGLINFGLLRILDKILSIAIVNNPILVAVLSNALTGLVGLGVGVSLILLFLNLEFQTR